MMKASAPILLKYQAEPVRHLLDRCRSQKGLLVWHAMGTGKSATGLSFIGTIDHAKIMLLLPENLLDVWLSEGIKFGIDLRKMIQAKKVVVHFYEKRKKTIAALKAVDAKSYILVADEAHHLIELVANRETMKATESYSLLKKLQEFQKILLLSGTPMYNDEADFRMLVNIAAGKIVLPIQIEEFKKLYYKTSLWRSIFLGWFLTFFDKYLYPTRDFVNAGLNLDMILRGSESSSKKFFDALISIIRKVLVNFEISAIVAVSIPLIVPLIILMLIRIALRSQTSKIRMLDGDKLANVVKSYVSFYEIPMDSRGSDYPKVMITKKACNYNARQIDLWLRFAMGKAKSHELVRLGVSKDIGEAEIFGDVTELDAYKYHGRIIGNLTFDKDVCPKFVEIERIMRGGNANIWQTVVYSNFDKEGGMLFADYLKMRKIRYQILKPSLSANRKFQILEKFAKNDISVLILHPSYKEGLSISNARQMHILEPVENQAVLEQIMARVARYGSHRSLEVKDRSVTIYLWTSVATSFYSKLIRFGQSQKLWAVDQKWVGPWAKMSRFGLDVTPDALITARSEVFRDNLQRLTTHLTKKNVLTLQHSKQPGSCRIITDIISDEDPLPVCKYFG